jgi:hypothetical protein
VRREKNKYTRDDMSIVRWWLVAITCCGIALLAGLRVGNRDPFILAILGVCALAALSAPLIVSRRNKKP